MPHPPGRVPVGGPRALRQGQKVLCSLPLSDLPGFKEGEEVKDLLLDGFRRVFNFLNE